MTLLSGTVKVLAGAIFVGGITFAGIVYTESGTIDNIKAKTDYIQERFELAIADNEFLKAQYDLLEGFYTDDVQDANSKITGLNSEILGLNSSIVSLNAEIKALKTAAGSSKEDLEQLEKDKAALISQVAVLEADKAAMQIELDSWIAKDAADTGDNTAAQEELQAEVKQLEGDLTQANSDIADLEVYISEADKASSYGAINKEEYTAENSDLTIERVAVTASPEAMAFDEAKATRMLQQAIPFEQAFASEFPVVVVGVVVMKTYGGLSKLAYEIDADSSTFFKSKTTSDAIPSAALKVRDTINAGVSDLLYLYNSTQTRDVYISTQNQFKN